MSGTGQQQTALAAAMLLLPLLLSLISVTPVEAPSVDLANTGSRDEQEQSYILFLPADGTSETRENANRITQHMQAADTRETIVQFVKDIASIPIAANGSSSSERSNDSTAGSSSSSSSNSSNSSNKSSSSRSAWSSIARSSLQNHAARGSICSSSGSIRSSGERAFAVSLNAADRDAVLRHYSVKAIVPDIAVTQASRCTSIKTLSAGLRASPTALDWGGCRSSNGAANRLVWVGQRCGATMQAIQYVAIYAMPNNGRNRVATSEFDGRPCIIVPDVNDKPWTRHFFGSGCGRTPTVAPTLPATLCSAEVATEACFRGCPTDPAKDYVTVTISLSSAVSCGRNGERSQVLQYKGRPCGPALQYVEWFEGSTSSGCTISRSSIRGTRSEQEKTLSDVFGYCGSNPGLMAMNSDLQDVQCFRSARVTHPLPGGGSTGNLTGSGTSSTSGPVLPRSPVRPGEVIPKGVQRIEAAADGTGADLDELPAAQHVVVAVIDSGIDRSHPDLNYLGGQSWLGASDQFSNEADPGVDNYGHGTMIAGVIGAKNNGEGIVGISPGLPLFSLKVVDGYGQVKSSNVIRALQWVISEGRTLGIRVINLSVAVAQTDPDADPVGFKALQDLYCPMIQQADEAGILVVVAAGNYGSDLLRYVPGVCPHAAVVTGVDINLNQPSVTTNYLPTGASPADKARVTAAPGVRILSTAPVEGFDRFYELPGTSMAAPHVAAVAANCLMSGACPANSTGAQILAKIQAAAAEKAGAATAAAGGGGGAGPRFGFKGDPATPDQAYAGRYYGNMVWSKW